MEQQPHIPVMLHEMLQAMAPRDGEIYVDGTFGAGGYSRALLAAANCRIYAIDRDPDVVPIAQKLQAEYPGRIELITGAFGDMEELLSRHQMTAVNGIVLDIGVSSMQLDRAERGFSFMHDAHLDMRMSQEGQDACALVNEAGEEELADIIYFYGGERKARRIARRIVNERQKEPITRTSQLASIVRSVVRDNHSRIDPATRTFQAIRIWVNDELKELERALEAAEKLLLPGGRLVVISFHSLEDAIVKRFFQQKSGKQEGVSRHIPMPTVQGNTPSFRILTRQAIPSSEQEIAENPRARSAKLRAACKLSYQEGVLP